MRFFKRLPLTTLYIVMHIIYFMLSNDMGDAIYAPTFTVPLPKGGAVSLSITMIFVAIAAVLLGFELRKSSRFQPRENNADAFLSMGVAGLYLMLLLFYSFFQTELFFLLTILAIIDAIIGLMAILGVSRRSFDVDDNNQ